MPRFSLGLLTHSHLESKQWFLGSPPGDIKIRCCQLLLPPLVCSGFFQFVFDHAILVASLVFSVTVSLNLDLLEWRMAFCMGPEQYGVADTNRTSPYTALVALSADPSSPTRKENRCCGNSGRASHKPPLYSQAAHPAFVSLFAV